MDNIDGNIKQHIQQLFLTCDLDGSGFIDRSELSTVCGELDQSVVSKVFEELDVDGDGQV